MLRELNLVNYGRHIEKKVEFKEGTNIIIGENRSGKTQICEAVSFALYGKTQNSTLEKIINLNADKVSANLITDDFDITRKRKSNSSSLEGLKDFELKNFLNIDYKEFLSIFYISSSEQQSLFDASYLRNFLINIFYLNKYSKIYDKLKMEYKILQEANIDIPKVNKDLLKKRFDRIKKYIQTKEDSIKKYQEIDDKIRSALNKISSKQGELIAQTRQIKKQINLLNAGKCYECSRPYSTEDIQAGLKKLNESLKKIQSQQKEIEIKEKEINTKDVKCSNIMNKIHRRINKAHLLISTIKAKAQQTVPKVNIERIKEIESILPVFNPKGFPSYLLQVYIPVITETANNLLNVIFSDTQIQIRTEKPESNKPDFKPFIKREDKTLELKELSGSERVLVNLCFRLGVMIIYKRLHETCIDTLIIDEGLERLDDINSIKILKLFENCYNLGFLKQAIVITHKDILKSQDNINYIELTRRDNES